MDEACDNCGRVAKKVIARDKDGVLCERCALELVRELLPPRGPQQEKELPELPDGPNGGWERGER